MGQQVGVHLTILFLYVFAVLNKKFKKILKMVFLSFTFWPQHNRKQVFSSLEKRESYATHKQFFFFWLFLYNIFNLKSSNSSQSLSFFFPFFGFTDLVIIDGNVKSSKC